MSRLMITLSASMFVMLLAGLVPVLSQDMGGKAEEPEAKNPMAEWMELQKPGPQHKALAESAGEWTMEGTWYGIGPDGKPAEMPIKGTSTMKMVYDRYLHEEMTFDDGSKMQGFIGYDNSAKEFQCCYIHTMDTTLRVYSGQADEKTGVVTFTGEWVEKGMGGVKMKSRMVSTPKSKDESTFDMYRTVGDGKEAKEMTMTYKRKK